jgi:putative peptide zinc metalloprotease protein
MSSEGEAFWQAVEQALDPAAYRPMRRRSVETARLHNRDEVYYVLKQPAHKTYVRMSEADYALWWQMNGRHRVKDLLFYNLKRYKSLPVGHLTTLINELRQGGFLAHNATNLYDQMTVQLEERAPESRGRRLLNGFLFSEWATDGLDPHFSQWYGWTRPLFSKWGQIILLLLLLVGGLLFGRLYQQKLFVMSGSGGWGVFTLILANLLVIGVHELAHGLATKHVGRELDRGGFLIYWGLPACFVDTRDTWMSSSRQRIMVSWAGPYSGLILGSVVSMGLTAVAHFSPAATTTLWAIFLYQLAFLAFLSVLINLNPLLELDGYFILMDWLEMPGLRSRAFQFWRRDAWPRFRASNSPRQFARSLSEAEHIFALFGLLAAVYSLFALWIAVNFWRTRLVPFAYYLWEQGMGGRLLLGILIVVFVMPIIYFVGLFGWGRIRRGLLWLAHRNLLARPEVLALLIGVSLLLGLPSIWFLLTHLPTGVTLWHLFVWLLYLTVTAVLVFIARQLPGSRFQWLFWAFAAAPLGLALSWLAGSEHIMWYDLGIMAAVTAVFAGSIVAWYTIQATWVTRLDWLLMGATLLLGLLLSAVQINSWHNGALLANGRWPATLYITLFTAVGVTLMIPLLHNFARSRFALAWAALLLGILILPFLQLYPQFQAAVITLWLFAALLYWLVGALTQFTRYEKELEDVGIFSERRRLINGFNHFLQSLFIAYEAIFGSRRLLAIQAELAQLAPLDADLTILQIADRARHALLVAVDRLDDLAGDTFTRRAGQAAYDSLPWLEAETLARHVLSQTQWGALLAQGFILSRDRRQQFIRQADVFAGLDQNGVLEVSQIMEEVTFRKGQWLTRAGHDALHFYLIIAGQVGAFDQGEQVALISTGGYFGIPALAGKGNYTYSYRSLTAVTAYLIHRSQFNPLLRADTTLSSQVSTGTAVRQMLRQMPLFNGLSPQELTTVEARLVPLHVAANEQFVQQGAPRTNLYIVADGLVEVYVTNNGQSTVVGTLSNGEHFGEYALFADTPYLASCRAKLDSQLLLLDEPTFDKLIATCDRMTHYVEQIGSGRLLTVQRHTALPS